MKRVLLVILVAAACSKKQGPPLAPLPPDQPEEPTAKKEDPKPKEQPPARPAPTGPLDVKIAYTAATTKLVKPGTGKRVAFKVAPKQGAKQAVELAYDFGVVQSVGEDSESNIAPTIVLGGTAEVTSGDGDWTITVDKVDALDTPGSKVPMDKFREVLKTTTGIKITGKVGANGQTGDVTLHTDAQGELTGQVFDLARLAMPAWPALPTEAIAPGAKWTATTSNKLADRLDVTTTTDYEVVSVKGNVWTIKGTTKITGADQMMQGGKISKITGTGTVELVWTEGTLFPTKYASKIESTFVASEAEPKGATAATLDFKLRLGGTITSK